MLVSFQNMNNDQDGCLSNVSNQSQPLMGPMKRLQLNKLNLSRWFNFVQKGLIGIVGLIFGGLLSIICLKKN
jgi:hypothetical protein